MQSLVYSNDHSQFYPQPGTFQAAMKPDAGLGIFIPPDGFAAIDFSGSLIRTCNFIPPQFTFNVDDDEIICGRSGVYSIQFSVECTSVDTSGVITPIQMCGLLQIAYTGSDLVDVVLADQSIIGPAMPSGKYARFSITICKYFSAGDRMSCFVLNRDGIANHELFVKNSFTFITISQLV